MYPNVHSRIIYNCQERKPRMWPSIEEWIKKMWYTHNGILFSWKRVFAMISVFSWQNSISICPSSFCIPRTNLPVTPGVSWLPSFVFQSPIMKRTSSFVLVLKDLVGLHRTVQLQLLQHYWLGHRLGLLWYWMVCLRNKQRSFCHFWDWTQAFWTPVNYEGYSLSSKGVLPTILDTMVIWIKFVHSHPS